MGILAGITTAWGREVTVPTLAGLAAVGELPIADDEVTVTVIIDVENAPVPLAVR